MADRIYEVEYEGRIYDIQAPEGIDEQELFAIAHQSRIDELLYGETEEPGFLDTLQEIPKGVAAGALGMTESALLGGATAFDEDTESGIRESVQDFFAPAQEYLAPDRGLEDSVTRKFSEALGSFVPMAGAAMLGPVGVGAGAAMGIGAGAGEASERARAAGATEEERGSAALKGALVGSTEMLPIGRLLGRAGKDAVGLLAKTKKVGKAAIEEALQEGGAGTLQNAIEMEYNQDQELWDGVLEQAGYGGGVGGFVAALLEMAAGRKARRTAGDTAPEEEVTPEETAPEQGIAGLLPPPDTTRYTTPEGESLTATELEQRAAEIESVLGDMPSEEVRTARDRRTQEEKNAETLALAEEMAAGREGANERAQERAALKAAERGDEAGFAQPDMFAAEKEKAEMDTRGVRPAAPAVPQETRDQTLARIAQESKPTAQNEEQLDMVPIMEQRSQEAAKAKREELAAQGRAVTQQDMDIKQTDQRVAEAQQARSVARRKPILDKVLAQTKGASQVNTERAFAKALKEQGFRDTTPTEQERQAIAQKTYAAEEGRISEDTSQTQIPEGLKIVPNGKGKDGKKATYNIIDEQRNVRGTVDYDATQPDTPWVATLDNGVTFADKYVNKVKDRIDAAGPVPVQVAPAPVQQKPAAKPAKAVSPVTAPTQEQVAIAPTEVAVTAPTDIGKAPKAYAQELVNVGATFEDAVKQYPILKGRYGKQVKAEMDKLQPTPKAEAKPAAKPAPKAETKPTTKVEDTPAAKPAPKAETKPAPKAETKPAPKAETKKATTTKVEQPKATPTTKAAVAKRRKQKHPYNTPETRLQHFYDERVENTESYEKEIGTNDDQDAVNTLLAEDTPAPKAKAKEQDPKAAATVYFKKKNRIRDVLDFIAFDIANDTPSYQVEASDPDAIEVQEMYKGTGAVAAKAARQWVDKNLGNQAKLYLEKRIKVEEASAIRANKYAAEMNQASRDIESYTEAELKERDAKARALVKEFYKDVTPEEFEQYVEYYKDNLDNTAVNTALANLYRPAHPQTRALIEENNLTGVLQILAVTNPKDKYLRQLARKYVKMLEKFNVAPRIEIIETPETTESGERRAGGYDVKRNVIRIDPEYGLNAWNILHETTHALTANFLRNNKSDPLTKQITSLFNAVKDQLGTAYGATNVDEFLAEGMSNPQFRKELARTLVSVDTGVQMTGLERWVQILRNFVNRIMGRSQQPMTKQVDLVSLEEFDVIANSIIAASPDVANSEFIRAASTNPEVGEILSNIVMDIPDYKPNRHRKQIAEALSDKNTTFTKTVKNLIRGALPLHALNDVSSKYFGKLGKQFEDVIHEQQAEVDRRSENYNAVKRALNKFLKANDTRAIQFHNLVHNSTVWQVDPDIDEQQAKKQYGKDPEKMRDYENLRKEFMSSKFGNEGRKMYRVLRNYYAEQHAEMLKAAETRLIEKFGQEEGRKVYKSFTDKLFEGGRLEPYFPLVRKGKYWIKFDAPSANGQSTETYKMSFESKAQRQAAMAEIEKVAKQRGEPKPKFEEYIGTYEKNFTAPADMSTMNRIMEHIDAFGAELSDPKNKENFAVLRDSLIDIYMDAIPDRSYLQGLRHRSGVLGYINDALVGLETRGHDMIRHISQMKYNHKFEDVRKNMYMAIDRENPEAKFANDEAAVGYYEEYAKRIDFAKNPMVSGGVRAATAFGFNWTLGMNVSSALVNLSQIPVVTYPFLGGKYGYDKAFSALGKATKVLMGTTDGKIVGTRAIAMTGEEKGQQERVIADAMFNLANLDPNDLPPQLARYKTLIEHAQNNAQLHRSIIYDLLDVDSDRGPLERFTKMSGAMFHYAERFNRQVTLIAAYDLALDSGKDPQVAADEAIETVNRTQGETFAAARPRWSQAGIGKILFMYKTFGATMTYMMLRMAKQGAFGTSKEERSMARKQLAGVFGMSGLVAGVSGLPLYGVISMMYDMFADDDEEDFDTVVRTAIGEPMFGGGLNALFGAEMGSRMAMTDLLFRAPAVERDQSIIWDAAELIGGPVLSVSLGVDRGIRELMLGEGEYYRGAEAAAPAALRNLMKAGRYLADDGAKTMRGDYVVEDLTMTNVGMQALGFAPAEYIRQIEQNAVMKGINKSIVAKKTKLLKKYYVAQRNGDWAAVDEIMSDMSEFNDKHPEVAITPDTIKRSMAQHQKTSVDMFHGVTIDKRLRNRINEMAAEWD